MFGSPLPRWFSRTEEKGKKHIYWATASSARTGLWRPNEAYLWRCRLHIKPGQTRFRLTFELLVKSNPYGQLSRSPPFADFGQGPKQLVSVNYCLRPWLADFSKRLSHYPSQRSTISQLWYGTVIPKPKSPGTTKGITCLFSSRLHTCGTLSLVHTLLS